MNEMDSLMFLSVMYIVILYIYGNSLPSIFLEKKKGIFIFIFYQIILWNFQYASQHKNLQAFSNSSLNKFTFEPLPYIYIYNYTHFQKHSSLKIYLKYIYVSFVFSSRKVMNNAGIFHIKGTKSFLLQFENCCA